jgi:hypothetical protein
MRKLVGYFIDIIKVARGILLGEEQARGCWGGLIGVKWCVRV